MRTLLVMGLIAIFAIPSVAQQAMDETMVYLTIEEYVMIDIVEPDGGYHLSLNPGVQGQEQGTLTVNFDVECNYEHSVSVALFEGEGAEWSLGDVNYGPHGPGVASGAIDVTASITMNNLAGQWGAVLILQVEDLRFFQG